MICEHCNDAVDGLHVAHSGVAVLQKVDTSGYQFYQCEDGQEHGGVTYQHYNCSPAHMLEMFSRCVQEHYTEALLHPIPPGGGYTILHRLVLGKGLTCKQCQAALTTQAYRFCLTISTPVNIVPDNSLDELGEWCCSLEHARESALATITNTCNALASIYT